MRDDPRILTRSDLARAAELVGLRVVELDVSDAPTVRVDVQCVPVPEGGHVVRHPDLAGRIENLRARLRDHGLLGVRWVIRAGDSPYRSPGNGG